MILTSTLTFDMRRNRACIYDTITLKSRCFASVAHCALRFCRSQILRKRTSSLALRIYDIIKNKTLEFMFLNVECTANIEK